MEGLGEFTIPFSKRDYKLDDVKKHFYAYLATY